MSRKVDEQEQARKVKVRLRMIQHFQQVSRNVSLTCRFFGISRSQFYIWLRRYEKQALDDLLPHPAGGQRFDFAHSEFGGVRGHV